LIEIRKKFQKNACQQLIDCFQAVNAHRQKCLNLVSVQPSPGNTTVSPNALLKNGCTAQVDQSLKAKSAQLAPLLIQQDQDYVTCIGQRLSLVFDKTVVNQKVCFNTNVKVVMLVLILTLKLNH